MEALRLLGAV